MLLLREKGHGNRRGLQFAAVRQASPWFLGLCFCRNMHWSEWVVVSFLSVLEFSSVVVAEGFLLRSFFLVLVLVFPHSVATKSFPFFSPRRSSDLEARRSKKRVRGGKRKKVLWKSWELGNAQDWELLKSRRGGGVVVGRDAFFDFEESKVL